MIMQIRIAIKIVTNKGRKVKATLKGAWYRRKFAQVGRGLKVYGTLKVRGEGKVMAGNNLHIEGKVLLYTGNKNALIRLGDKVSLFGSNIEAAQCISIGDDTLVGSASIYDSDWHGIDGNQAKVNPVKIGQHVWICKYALVLKGVTVGDNAIVGAGAVVTKNVPDKTIVAGNPAVVRGSTLAGYTT